MLDTCLDRTSADASFIQAAASPSSLLCHTALSGHSAVGVWVYAASDLRFCTVGIPLACGSRHCACHTNVQKVEVKEAFTHIYGRRALLNLPIAKRELSPRLPSARPLTHVPLSHYHCLIWRADVQSAAHVTEDALVDELRTAVTVLKEQQQSDASAMQQVRCVCI